MCILIETQKQTYMESMTSIHEVIIQEPRMKVFFWDERKKLKSNKYQINLVSVQKGC